VQIVFVIVTKKDVQERQFFGHFWN